MGKTTWIWAAVIAGSLVLLTLIFAALLVVVSEGKIEPHKTGKGKIALIKISGIITTEAEESLFGIGKDSEDIVELIEEAQDDPEVRGIIIEINSPGGSPVASDEIAQAIKSVNKTTVAWIREMGASGGYWVASAADHIVANRMSITGSIGVFASYLEFDDLLEEYNITYQRLVAGKYKDLGSPFKDLSNEERQIMQEKLDTLHSFFIEEVAQNRNLPKSKVEKIATGLFYLGSEAKELGLVDELGGKKEAIAYIEDKEKITASIKEFKKEKSLMEVLGSIANKNSFYVGQGIGQSITKIKEGQSLRITT